MLKSEFDLYRGTLVSQNPLLVVIPGALSNIPLEAELEEGTAPAVGSSVWVRANHDFTQVYLVVLDIGTLTGPVTIDGELTVDGTIFATEIESTFVGPNQIKVKNTSGGTLTKGTPVYATGSVGASGAVEVQASDASIASTMPSLGLLQEDLNGDSEGHAVVVGIVFLLDTSSYAINDELYVAPGGGLTTTRPTSSTDLVQKIGRVVRVNASTGEILVLGAGRTNDTPNTITVDDGSAATPGYGFVNDPGTGMYHNSPDVIAFSIGGTEELAFNNSTFFFKNNDLSEIGNATFGKVTVSSTDSSAVLDLDSGGTSGTMDARLRFLDDGVTRWITRYDESEDEYQVRRHNTGGSFVDTPLKIDGATGDVTLTGKTKFTTGDDRIRLVGAGTERPFFSLDYAGTRAGYFGFPSAASGGITYLAADSNALRLSGGGGITLASATTAESSLSIIDGTVSAPGIRFASDTNTGFWRPASGDIAATGDGTELWYAYSAGTIVGGRVTGSAFLQSGGGSESSPVYTMWNENNTGFYRYGTDDWGWTANAGLSILMIGGSAVDERLRLQHNNSNESCYISYYGNGSGTPGRLGYVGYPGSDDLFVKNEDAGGNIFIDGTATIYVRQSAVTKGAWDATGVYFQEAYDYTATNSNCDVSNTGRLSRDTSSLRYKADVEPIDMGLAKQALKDLDFIWYRFGEEQGNDRRHGRFGSTAESAHEKGYPWLATYEYDRECGCEPLGKWVKRREWVEEQKIPIPKEEQEERGRWEIIEPHWREVDYWDENFRIEHTCGTEKPIGFDYRGFTALVAAVTEEQEEHLDRHDDEIADLRHQIEVLGQRLAGLETGRPS